MTYRAPGFYELPPGSIVPMLCSRIREQSFWERDLTLTLDGLGRTGRKMKTITIEEIVALRGEGVFKDPGPVHRALLHIIMRWLHHMGIIDRYPAIVGYASSPYLSLGQAADAAMSDFVLYPSIESMGGKENFNLEAFRGALPRVIRELAFQGTLKANIVERLRRKLGQIAFKLATGQPVTQAERSAYVLWSDRYSPYSKTQEEYALNPTAPSEPIAVLDTGDPLVLDAWDRVTKNTEPGPFLRFATLVSNTSLENPIYWYGPRQASLTFGMGYRFGYGRYFDEPRVHDAAVFPWTPEDQLTSARERAVSFVLDDKNAALKPPILATMMDAQPFPPCWDLPQVEIRVSIDGGMIAANEYAYWSDWRERHVSSRLGASPSTMLLDLAITHAELGEGRSSPLTMASLPLFDYEESFPFLGVQAPFIPDYRARIVLPGPLYPVGRQVVVKDVDMLDFYRRQGTTAFPPAFREYASVPRSWLHVPDPAAEDFIAARLGLTMEQKQQALYTIRISHNWDKLARFLSPAQLPLTRERMENLCRALLGG